MCARAFLAAMLSAGLATGGQAASAHLSDAELKAAISGKTVNISTPLRLPLTVNYGANGIMVGTVGTALAAYLGSSKDRGRWRIQNGRLCQKWFKWLAAEEICMQLSQDGDIIRWKTESGRTGTASIEPGPPVLAGASASGLGAPPPRPELSELSPAITAPNETGVDQVTQADTSQAAAGAHDSETSAPLPVRRPPHIEPEPRLIEPHREIVLASAASSIGAAAMVVRKVSLTAPRKPYPRPQAQMAVVRLESPEDALFSGPALPMQIAGLSVANAAMQHRWCLTNILGADSSSPSLSVRQGDTPSSLRHAGPSLLVVATEKISPDELPLQQPSCITPRPALHHFARRLID